MTLEDAIKRHRHLADHYQQVAGIYVDDNGVYAKEYSSAIAEAYDNEQLAEWLEELKDLRLLTTGILGEMLQDRPDDFKLYNIKRMIDDYTVKGE